MTRLAGDSRAYTWALLDPNGKPTEHRMYLPSPTSIIKAVMPPPAGAMSYHGYNTAIAGVVEMLPNLRLPDQVTEDGWKKILKAAAMDPNSRLREAGKRGTAAHDYLEQLVTTGEIGLQVDPYERAVLAWWRTTGPEPIAAEAPLWSLEHQFCGTADLVWFDRNGDRILTDLKTHKGDAYDSDFLQVAAYRMAWNEMYPTRMIDRVSILLAREDGSFTETYEPDKDYPAAFLACLDIYRRLET